MPLPYGTRGALVFGADELPVLRRALALALHPVPPSGDSPASGRTAGEVRELLRLAEAVDEAAREGGRLRAFLCADVARHRAALPGAASGYLERLREALAEGYTPGAADLEALRSLCAAPAAGGTGPAGPGVSPGRALLRRCEELAARTGPADVPVRDGAPAGPPPAGSPVPGPGRPGRADALRPAAPSPAGAAPGTTPGSAPAPAPASAPVPFRAGGGPARLLALPGGRSAGRSAGHSAGRSAEGEPAERPRPQPKRSPQKPGPERTGEPGPERDRPPVERPESPEPPAPSERPERPQRPARGPGRPVPTPAEVFPPRRRPAPPQESRAAG